MIQRYVIKALKCHAGNNIVHNILQTLTKTRGIMSNNHTCKHNSVRTLTSLNGQKSFTVCVEGNIASGKTTFLEYFKGASHAEVYEEPVKKWRNVKGENALELMYTDPKRWALTLQTYIQLTMISLHTQEQTKPVKLMERSIYSAKYCFVENLYKSGLMPDIEYVVLTEWFDWLLDTQNIKVDLIVYLQTSPETCLKRIHKRCRNEEKKIPLEYLQALHDLHEDWLLHEKFKLPAPVLILDGNNEVDEMHKLFEEKKTEILCGYS